MKVFENIERFHRKIEADSMNKVSDQEFKQGLEELIRAIVPLRRNQMECISQYQKTRDELPLTKSIAEKEPLLGSWFEFGQREVDLAVLKVIYEDRYSFGYLYWHILSKYEGHDYDDYTYDYKDQDAPFKKSLIEYAIDFDLEETVKEYKSLNIDERYCYAKQKLRQSKNRHLIDHPIKDRYEKMLADMMAEYGEELKELDLAALEAAAKRGEKAGTEEASEFVSTFLPKGRRYATALLEYLHTGIDGQKPSRALPYIQAAINAGLINKPTYKESKKEFSNIGEKSSYRIGAKGFRKDKEPVKGITEDLLKRFP